MQEECFVGRGRKEKIKAQYTQRNQNKTNIIDSNADTKSETTICWYGKLKKS